MTKEEIMQAIEEIDMLLELSETCKKLWKKNLVLALLHPVAM